jgi:hypothetical protein
MRNVISTSFSSEKNPIYNITLSYRDDKKEIVYLWGSLRYKYNICLKINSQKRLYFSFYGSNSDFTNKKHLEGKELLFSLYCFFSDALGYCNNKDINDFFKEFGYTDVSEGLKVYNSCKRTYLMLIKNGFNENDICQILNEMQEKEIW